MDVGVGSFVFSLGIVSTRQSAVSSSMHLPNRVIDSVKRSAPILFLGVVRVLMVKGTEYPVSAMRKCPKASAHETCRNM